MQLQTTQWMINSLPRYLPFAKVLSVFQLFELNRRGYLHDVFLLNMTQRGYERAKPHCVFHMSTCLQSKCNPPEITVQLILTVIYCLDKVDLTSHIQQTTLPVSNDYSIYHHIFATYSQSRNEQGGCCLIIYRGCFYDASDNKDHNLDLNLCWIKHL